MKNNQDTGLRGSITGNGYLSERTVAILQSAVAEGKKEFNEMDLTDLEALHQKRLAAMEKAGLLNR